PPAAQRRDAEEHRRRARSSEHGDDLHLHQAARRGPEDCGAGSGGGVMKATSFSGPLAAELSDFTATLEASAVANKTLLTKLRALDRLTQETMLVSGTLDEAFARAWLAPCESRGPNTRLARYHLLRRFCRFLAKRRPQTFIPGESLRPRRRPA